MSKLPKKFEAKELRVTGPDWEEPNENGRFKADKTAQDFEALGAYLSAFPFKWKVKLVHDEPCGTPWRGGTPQMRIEGTLEGEEVKFGKFEVAFHGCRINVTLPPGRQQLFEQAMAALPAPEEESKIK